MSSKYDWDDILGRRTSGETWPEIAKDLGMPPSTLRSAFVRAKERMQKVGATDGMRILGIDIETAPHTAYVWRMWDANVSTDQVLETGRVMCFASQWFDDPFSEVEFWSEHHQGHRKMVERAHELLTEADAVVHYNGSRFDIPMLNREFVKAGMSPPDPSREIDLIRTVKKRFKFSRNSLDAVLRELGLGAKEKHEGFTLWVKCMRGDPEAWENMKRYNLGDVTEMKKLYDILLPWISTHPNHALYSHPEGPTCPNCGGTKLHRRGYSYTKTQKYQKYQCQNCGTWTRERYTAIHPDVRKAILTQA